MGERLLSVSGVSGDTPTADGAVVGASGVSGSPGIGAVAFSTWSRAATGVSTAKARSPTTGGCLMGPLLPCASVAAGGGPVSQLLRFALGLLCFGALVNKAFGVGIEARPRVPGVAGAALPLSCAVCDSASTKMSGFY